MNKVVKNIPILIIILIIFVTLIISNKSENNLKVYLSDKYYNTGSALKLNVEDIDSITNDSYILFIYNNACGMARNCDEVFSSVFNKLKIDYYKMPYDDFSKTKYNSIVKYAPSIIIIKDEEVLSYLDANNDEHLKYYQNEDDFERWLLGRILVKK